MSRRNIISSIAMLCILLISLALDWINQQVRILASRTFHPALSSLALGVSEIIFATLILYLVELTFKRFEKSIWTSLSFILCGLAAFFLSLLSPVDGPAGPWHFKLAGIFITLLGLAGLFIRPRPVNT